MNLPRIAVSAALSIAGLQLAAVASGDSTEQTVSVRDGVYSLAQAQAGELLYGAACSACHLPSLGGGVNKSPPLKGERFIAGWDGKPLRALYSRIVSTMPRADPGSLSEQATLSLVAFILQANGYPPSSGSALRDAGDLDHIRFVATK